MTLSTTFLPYRHMIFSSADGHITISEKSDLFIMLERSPFQKKRDTRLCWLSHSI